MRPIHVLLSVLLTCPVAYAADSAKSATETMEVNAAMEYVVSHENAIVIDVRTPAEFNMSHITNAVNVDVQDDSFAEMAAALDPDKTYIVHCTKNPKDGRSSRALETLRELGFRNLYGLEGGYVAWKEAELPLSEAEP